MVPAHTPRRQRDGEPAKETYVTETADIQSDLKPAVNDKLSPLIWNLKFEILNPQAPPVCPEETPMPCLVR